MVGMLHKNCNAKQKHIEFNEIKFTQINTSHSLGDRHSHPHQSHSQ